MLSLVSFCICSCGLFYHVIKQRLLLKIDVDRMLPVLAKQENMPSCQKVFEQL